MRRVICVCATIDPGRHRLPGSSDQTCFIPAHDAPKTQQQPRNLMYRFKLVSVMLAFAVLTTLNFGCQANTMPDADNHNRERSESSEAELLQLGANGPPKLTVDTDAGVVRLMTVSTGCTRPEHFTIELDAEGNYVASRVKADRCRRRPFVVTYEYALDDLPQG